MMAEPVAPGATSRPRITGGARRTTDSPPTAPGAGRGRAPVRDPRARHSPDHLGRLVDRPGRAGTPCLRPDRVPVGDQPERDRPVGRSSGTPRRAVAREAERRVPGPRRWIPSVRRRSTGKAGSMRWTSGSIVGEPTSRLAPAVRTTPMRQVDRCLALWPCWPGGIGLAWPDGTREKSANPQCRLTPNPCLGQDGAPDRADAR
jgi:hypothetical protein